MKEIILASNSPRRKELMNLLGMDFKIIPSDVEEKIDYTLDYEEMVMDIAFQKALDVFKQNKDAIVLGFDTLVVMGEIILGKPKNKEEAKQYLRILANNSHMVYTGCTLLSKGYSKSFYSYAEVTFTDISEDEIEEYVNTGEPLDKAGAYGIQGYGSKFIAKIAGDYYAIVGFPVSKIYKELKALEKDR